MSLRKLTLFELKDQFTKGEISAAEMIWAFFEDIRLKQ